MLKLKVQNIYIKPVLKTMLKCEYLRENVIDLRKQKIAQNVAITSGYFYFSKNHNEHSKVAQLIKIPQSGHPEGK